jgi:hypothetical protein
MGAEASQAEPSDLGERHANACMNDGVADTPFQTVEQGKDERKKTANDKDAIRYSALEREKDNAEEGKKKQDSE